MSHEPPTAPIITWAVPSLPNRPAVQVPLADWTIPSAQVIFRSIGAAQGNAATQQNQQIQEVIVLQIELTIAQIEYLRKVLFDRKVVMNLCTTADENKSPEYQTNADIRLLLDNAYEKGRFM